MSTSQEDRAVTAPYMDASLPIEERVADLLGRMSLEEKARQMDQYHGSNSFSDKHYPNSGTAMAKDGKLIMEKVERILGDLGCGCIHDLYPPDAEPINQLQRYAVEETRLGIPILFSEEGLHGLTGPGNTIFPQAITLASCWNGAIAEAFGHALARELRAYGIHETFSPVIDLARDPRWGRMEETYGEDTYLASRLAVRTVRGMQGHDLSADDTIIAEPKHFAAYGTPRGGLNCASTHVGMRDMRTYYLPIFEAAFVEGGAMATMCSYNSIDGVPAAASQWLLTDLLRREWGFKGFVRSDLGAVNRLMRDHGVATDAQDAIRQSVEAGLDLQYYDFDHDTYQNAIIDQVRAGTLSEEAVDRAVSAILRTKFMLGLFENPYTDTELFEERVRCQEHIDLSLQIAREGICLLKNEDDLLPLKKDLKKIAVIGPNAAEARLGDYSAIPHDFDPITALEGIQAAVAPETEVVYVQGTAVVAGQLETVPARWLRSPDGKHQGLRAEYYDNPELAGEAREIRVDGEIDFNWIYTTPAEGVGPDPFSVRWTGKLVPDRDIRGFLGTSSQDSMRLYIDGEPFVDGWNRGTAYNTNLGREFQCKAGTEHDICVEFRKDKSAIQVQFGYSETSDDIERAAAAARDADVAILCVGDSRETCGEGRDRTNLNLPGHQLDLVKAVHATGTPVVLVLQVGRAMTLNWEARNIPAIMNAWFPGEQGGRAIADVLFGDYNPAGRLPVSFPKTVGQIPLYYNQLPFGVNQYIDCDREPLYPFGHGLSYTTFEYGNLQVTPEVASRGEEVRVTVDVTNTGTRAGDEVVQLYINDVVSSVVRPLKELRGFERIHLAPGETKAVEFTLHSAALRLLNRDMEWVVEPGVFEVMVGGSSVTSLQGTFEILV